MGSYLTEFGDCEQCAEGCVRCNKDGCLVCEGNRLPV